MMAPIVPRMPRPRKQVAVGDVQVSIFSVVVVAVTLAVIDILVILLVKQRDANLELHQIQHVYTRS